jgi:hypothetical protein
MAGEFEDLLSSVFGGGRPRATTPPNAHVDPRPVSNPMPAIRGRKEDGVLWVRAEDVADALEALSPTTNARLIKKLRG